MFQLHIFIIHKINRRYGLEEKDYIKSVYKEITYILENALQQSVNGDSKNIELDKTRPEIVDNT